MKKIFIIALVLLTTVASAQMDKNKMKHVYDVPKMPTEEIHSLIQVAIAKAYFNANHVIQANTTTKVVVKGYFELLLSNPRKELMPGNWNIETIHTEKVPHTLVVRIKDGKYMLELELGGDYVYEARDTTIEEEIYLNYRGFGKKKRESAALAVRDNEKMRVYLLNTNSRSLMDSINKTVQEEIANDNSSW